MIYVTEGPAWEYKQLVRDRSTDKLPTDAELNALGHKSENEQDREWLNAIDSPFRRTAQHA